MRPRTEVLLALTGLGLAAAIASSLGRARRDFDSSDTRLSTYLAGPNGARGLVEALERFQVESLRWRRRLRELDSRSPSTGREAFVLLEPTYRLGPFEIRTLVEWHAGPTGGDLVLAGPRAREIMRCFGWSTEPASSGPVPIELPRGAGDAPEGTMASHFLVPTEEREVVEPGLAETTDPRLCTVPELARVDTLLLAADSRPVALRLDHADLDRSVVLVSEADLFRNRALRRTEAGPLVLGLFVGRYQRVTFDESHHGFSSGGSLAGAALAWSRRSPWGWALWQLAIVGLLALLFGAVRFGPVRPGLERRRRSPLEHVRALASALAAARGHDTAITAIVRGLRRRLQPSRPVREDPRPWLRELESRAPDPGTRAAAARLLTLTTPGQSSAAVLQASHAVEDLWQKAH